MSFDFNQVVDRRRDSNSIKWHLYGADVLPMWVADMDFKVPEAVTRALHAHVDHGVFGYEMPSPTLLNTIKSWCKRQYNWDINTDEIVDLPGLVSGLNVVSRAFGYVGDSAITLTPVYPPFLSAPTNQGLQVIQVPMRYVKEGEHRFHYEVDFDAFERAITPRTRIFILCNPHNPTGHEYTREELTKLGEICLKHNVVIVSDEIHCDLLLDGTRHTPLASLSDELAQNTITLMAPSKTFNVPGLGFSFAVIKNKKLRDRMKDAAMGIVPHTNVLGMTAAQAAFSQCDDWLAALRTYLTENRNVMMDFVDENMPEIRTSKPEATYLGWLDCREAKVGSNAYDFFMKNAKVALNNGPTFGLGGEGFVRFNFGCTRATMLQALEQMRKALRA